MQLVGIVLWALFAVAFSVVAVHWQAKREATNRARAYEEILAERGVRLEKGETPRQALIRARAADSMRPIRGVSAPSIRLPANSRHSFTAHESPSSSRGRS